MSEIIIRRARLSDIPAIQPIYAEAVLNSVASYELDPPDHAEMTLRFTAITEQGFPYIAAEKEGVLLGYAYASPYRTRPAYRWVVEDSIYIHPDSRGLGIGRTLLEKLIDECTQLGFRQMVAIIGGPQPASVALHQKAGFVHAGTISASGFKHGRWLDTVTMQRALGAGSDSLPDTPPKPFMEA